MIEVSKIKRISRRKVKQKTWRAYKHSYQSVMLGTPDHRQIVFILGCQRSGTSLMGDLIDRDISSRVYQEFSELSSQDESKLRLNPLPDVERIVNSNKAPLIVLKPLVETQNAPQLLDYFPNSRAIWMFRDYKDVAASKLKKSGLHNGIRDMQFIVEQRDHWRAEHVPDTLRKIITELYDPNMNPYDGAALYWYVRNNFYFQYNINEHSNVLLCKYEDFVGDPESQMRRIYHFLDRPFPGQKLVSDVFATSVGKGNKIDLSPAVEELCQVMWQKLDDTYHSQPWPIEEI